MAIRRESKKRRRDCPRILKTEQGSPHSKGWEISLNKYGEKMRIHTSPRGTNEGTHEKKKRAGESAEVLLLPASARPSSSNISGEIV